MNIADKYLKKGNGEKGIALLFTLGMLTVLLVLALGFATTSITQRRGAATNTQGTVARLLAESALERVVGTLQIYDESVFAFSHCDINTHTGSPPQNRGTTDWIHRLGTLDPGSTDSGPFQWNSAYTDINWEYVTVNDGVNDKIIGRVAYVIIPGGGLDPGVLVKTGVDEKSNSEPRQGAEVNEINLQSIDPAIFTAVAAGTTDKMNVLGTSSGLYNINWLSFTKLFKDVGITSSDTKNKFRKWFVIDAAKDAEAYWVDKDNDKNININTADDTKNELCHRFNLARTDWNSLTVGNILNAPVPADEYNSADIFYNGLGLRWLANFGKDSLGADITALKGTFPTLAARRNQIAANLKDYCDSDSAVTSDQVAPFTVNPTYMGNEMTPYINELGLKITATETRTIASSKKNSTVTWYYSCGGEIINIYGTNFSIAPTLRLVGNVSFSYNFAGTITPLSTPFDRTYILLQL